MSNRSMRVFAVAVGLLIISVPVFGHHANAIFDVGKRNILKGTVVEWFWANPHCLLRFDVKDDNGQVVHWVGETQAPPNVIPFGWTKQSFKPGDEVTVTVEPGKSGRPVGRILQVVFADGRTLGLGQAVAPAPAAGAPPAP